MGRVFQALESGGEKPESRWGIRQSRIPLGPGKIRVTPKGPRKGKSYRFHAGSLQHAIRREGRKNNFGNACEKYLMKHLRSQGTRMAVGRKTYQSASKDGRRGQGEKISNICLTNARKTHSIGDEARPNINTSSKETRRSEKRSGRRGIEKNTAKQQ